MGQTTTTNDIATVEDAAKRLSGEGIQVGRENLRSFCKREGLLIPLPGKRSRFRVDVREVRERIVGRRCDGTTPTPAATKPPRRRRPRKGLHPDVKC